jgi:hypothetical protein
MFRKTTITLISCCLFAGCSGQKHPSEDQLKEQLASMDPQLLEVESVTAQYSPMKEVLGTTLPEGSLQAACKISAKTKRDLYVEIDPSNANSAEEKGVAQIQLRARAINNTRVEKVSKGLDGQEEKDLQAAYDGVENLARGSILSRRTPAGQVVQFHVSILVIPQVDSWKFQPLDSDWQNVQRAIGQVQNSFTPMFSRTVPPILGSPEGQAYVDSLKSAVDKYETAESKLTSTYEQTFRDNSAALLTLVRGSAKLEGQVQVNSFSSDYGEPITGSFAITKDNEGTLTIESKKDKSKRLVCHFRLLTPEILKGDSSISVPFAAKRTITLTPEHPGDQAYDDFYRWDKFEGYLGLSGKILSGKIEPKSLWGSDVKLRFSIPSGGSA